MIDFLPIVDSKLGALNKNSTYQAKARSRAEDKYCITEWVDGKRGISELEKSLYSVISLPEPKEAMLNGIYFLERNTLLNRKFGNNFDGSLYRLKVDANRNGASAAEIDGAVFKARYDHLLKNSTDAQAIFKHFGKEGLSLFVKAWCKPTHENQQKVLDFTKQFVPDYDAVDLQLFDSTYFTICYNLVNDTSSDDALLGAMGKLLDNRLKKKSNEDLEVSR